MIIKSKRVRARGPALKRAPRHITDGEDNDAVELIFGNVADLEGARNDALRLRRSHAAQGLPEEQPRAGSIPCPCPETSVSRLYEAEGKLNERANCALSNRN
jgi:hypothetical protein